MARMVRVAAAQYPIERLATFAGFRNKLADWVAEAARNGAQLLVFPEYAAMELTQFAGDDVASNLKASLHALQPVLQDYKATLAELARDHNVYILGGSAPVLLASGEFVNRARLFAPSGASACQEKLIMTRFEQEDWGISASQGLTVFDAGFAKIGIAICYDAEFPLLVRALAVAGAEIILVPSNTDTMASYNRVRIACAARALENQVYAVQSPTVGNAPWSAAIDINLGAAGFFAPPDRLFPADGVLAMGEFNKPGWVYAALDLALLEETRAEGEVLNHQRWDDQHAILHGGKPAAILVLT